MTALVKSPLRGELIAPGAGLTLVVAPHPLSTSSFSIEAAAGLTLAELAETARTISGHNAAFAAFINGEVIAEGLWRRVRPKPGTVVLLRAVAGLDNELTRTLLSIGVLAAGAFLAPVIAPVLGLSASLVGAAITVGGQLLINALFPPARPQLSQDHASQTYSIGAGSNTADPFGVVPAILGTNRVYPRLGASSYTEFVGSDQYLRMLVIWGYGPLDISSIKIGETPLEAFDDVQIETRQGYADDAPLSLYPNEVVQEDLSVDLTAAAGAQLRTSTDNADELSIDVVAPGGVVRIDGNGGKNSYSVLIKAEYRAAGSADPWQLMGNLDLTSRATDVIRTGLRVTVPRGQYDVQVTKTSADYAGSDSVQEQVVWTALRTLRNAEPIAFAVPLAKSAIRIKATSQLNGAVDTLNGIVKTISKEFDGVDAWVDGQLTKNPADLFRLVLQGPANARPVADTRINLDNIEEWWRVCRDRDYSFNMVRDFSASVFDTLKAIAAAGRATVRFTDGKWDVVWDDPDAPIVQHFTPRNSSGFSGSRAYRALPHGLRVRFVNEDAGYAQDERIVYDDGYAAENATLFEGLEFPGVTDPDLIWKFGRFQIAQARLRPEQYSLTVDFEHLVAQRGDRVRVSHDVAMWGFGDGRVKAVADSAGAQRVTLDEPVAMEADATYAIRFRLADGTSLLRDVVTEAGESKQILLQAVGDLPAAGDLFMFGKTDEETVVLRVLKIEPGADLSAKVTMVDDAPAISQADQGAIPAFDSQISVPVDLNAAAPIDLSIVEVFAGFGGYTSNGAIFKWAVFPGEYPAGFDIEVRDDDGDGLYRPAGSAGAGDRSILVPDLDEGKWSFRVRARFADSTNSKWAELGNQQLLGVAGVPVGNVQNLRTSYQDNTSVLTWDEVADFRTARYLVKKGDSWDEGQSLGEVAHPPFTTYGDGTYWVAAVVRPEPGVVLYSPVPASVVVAGSLLVANVIDSHDEAADGWPGVVSAGGAVVGADIKTSVTETIVYYTPPDAHLFDALYARPTRLGATWKSTGEPADQNILADPNILANPDLLGAASAQFVDSWVEVRVAQTGTNDAFAPADEFAVTDAFAGTFDWTDWVKFAPGVYVGRFFELRLALMSHKDGVNAVGQQFTISADVPDRIERYTNHALAAGGETFQFTPEGSGTAAPFHGGPGGAVVPNIQVTILNPTAGDIVNITGVSLSQATIQVLNGGVGSARNVNIIFQGW